MMGLTRKNNFIIVIIGMFVVCGCNQKHISFNVFVKEKIQDRDSCVFDMKEYFDLEYDTMYVFGSFTPIEGINSFLKIYDNHCIDIMMPKDFYVPDSQNKIILIKEGVIIFDKDVTEPYLMNDGEEIYKTGLFDGEPTEFYAKIFVSSKFKIFKNKNDSSFSYTIKNIVEK